MRFPMMHLRRLSWFALPAALIPLVAASAADAIKAESDITAVTVYVDRAIVTRTAHVELPEGTQEIQFAALPASLNPDLIQVSGTGAAEAMILEVRAVAAQVPVPANARHQELQKQLHGIQAEMRTLTDKAGVLQAQRDFLDRMKVAATTAPGKDAGPLPTIDQWERLMTFYSDGIGKLGPQMQELDQRKEEVQGRLNAVQREIASLQPQSARSVNDVFVRVDVTKPGPLDLTLAYTVAAASWAPTYDVRVAGDTKTVNLGYAAMVHQSTGEDWHAVKLTLSTARPAIGGTPPELSPWYVRQEQPHPLFKAARNAPTAMAGAAADAVREQAKVNAFAVPEALVEAGLTAATFTVAHPTDIPADNAPHKVPVASVDLQAELTHLAVPKLAEYAYLQASVQNTSAYPLIAGPVNLYLDRTFVARSTLRTVMPGEKFELDLGVDDGVTVKRKLINRLTEDTGLVSRRLKLTYNILTTVQNNRAHPIKMVVKDQLPVSQYERIEVELVQPPLREVKEDDDGTLTWTFDLAPGAKRELPFKFSVEHPADLAVEGLE